MATSVEGKVQQRLQIPWVQARDLVQEAQQAQRTDAASSADALVEQACAIFGALPKAEQARRRNGTPKEEAEPDWKRKLREKAERQEAEWRTQQKLVQTQAKVQETLRAQGLPEAEVQATTVKSIRKIEGAPPESASSRSSSGGEKPIEHVKVYACYCVIQ